MRVALFVTCLADLFRPSVAFASIKLLEQAGCEVTVPLLQTCCGQPAYNSGDYEATVPLARQVITMLEAAEHVVVPSGSCTSMICHHYPRLLEGVWRDRALELAAKTFELTVFLKDIARIKPQGNSPSEFPAVTYHDGCAGLRDLDIREQPRQLLRDLCGIEISELQQSEVCCGFGGTFSVKNEPVSTAMAQQKVQNALETGAEYIVSTDASCLIHLDSYIRKNKLPLKTIHIIDVLASGW